MRTGAATPQGTERFKLRFPAAAEAGHFRRLGDLWVSSIGLGTYLGEPSDEIDRGYEEAVAAALERGVNLFDSAINYRHQRSERALGRALERAFADGVAARDEIVVATKAGFLPLDAEVPEDPAAYLRREYVEPGTLGAGELVAGSHCLAPSFLADQLRRSRANLGLETIDLYYLHNPETQLAERSSEQLLEGLGVAFGWLERELEEGGIAGYGVATWDGLRVPPAAPRHLSLEALVARAGEGLTVIQAPLNLAMPEALAAPTQEIGDVVVPLAVAARHFDLGLVTSASLMQMRLGSLPPEIGEAFPGLESDAQRSLQFTRSLPGVTTALVGMSSTAHVEENLALAEIPPATAETIQSLFS